MNWTPLVRGGAFNDGRFRNKVRLSVSGRLGISKDAYKMLGEPIFIKVYTDKDSNAIGIEPFDINEVNCYKVSTHRGTAFSANCSGLQNILSAGDYEYQNIKSDNKYVYVK